MKILITGAAGFIGSHLAEKLVSLGHTVTGIDCFTDYYPRKLKEDNLSSIAKNKNFTLIEEDLLKVPLEKTIKGTEIIFHQSAQAGVRPSWGSNFDTYIQNNILATQKLLEASKNFPIKKFIFASSSSVYGDSPSLPVKETDLTRPMSPYGVSKLAAENLCMLYNKNFKVPVISLRYFTVFGPRQRPDMAFNKFIKAILNGEEIPLFSDGSQTRDFTFVSDVVDVNIQAMESNVGGEIFNIAGGARISVKETISKLEKLLDKKAKIKQLPVQKGDVKHTFADIGKAKKLLGYKPKIKIDEGLKQEIDWLKDQL